MKTKKAEPVAKKKAGRREKLVTAKMKDLKTGKNPKGGVKVRCLG
jgi:hypothetical protein